MPLEVSLESCPQESYIIITLTSTSDGTSADMECAESWTGGANLPTSGVSDAMPVWRRGRVWLRPNPTEC